MKKIAIITYHAPHNFGSFLQAFALQKALENQGHKVSILNYRNEGQKNIYKKPKIICRFTIKGLVRSLIELPFYTDRKKRYNKFENYIKTILNTTYEFSDKDFPNNLENKYDVFISASDQIWNYETYDFTSRYLLDFIHNKKKISYASSCGRCDKVKDKKMYNMFSKYLACYDFISVREESSANLVENIINKRPQIVLDPTFLLDKKDWENLIDKYSKLKKIARPYLLYYTFRYDKNEFDMVKHIAKEKKLKIVFSFYMNRKQLYPLYINKLSSGPFEFLDLIRNASLIIGQSFHSTVFSLIFHKPFYAINGLDDNRMGNLLRLFHLENRSLSLNNYKEKSNIEDPISFSSFDNTIESEIKSSLEYLKEAIDGKSL